MKRINPILARKASWVDGNGSTYAVAGSSHRHPRASVCTKDV